MKVEIKKIINIAREAGDAILEIYQKDFEVYTKKDESPLTEADQAANTIILEKLVANYPDIPYISEEVKQNDYFERKDWEYCWLIDPLDGTKEFIKKGLLLGNIEGLSKDDRKFLMTLSLEVLEKEFGHK